MSIASYLPRSTLPIIKASVAQAFDITVRELESDRRARRVARPRQVAMFLSRELTTRSLPEIGRAFGGRDHTTVMHACRTIENLMPRDLALKSIVEDLRQRLPTDMVPPAPDSLDEAAKRARNDVVLQAKTMGGSTVIGDPSDMRSALYEVFGEKRISRGDVMGGDQIELLVSSVGTWSLVSVSADGSHAKMIAHGKRWQKVNGSKPVAAPDAEVWP